MGRPKPVIWRHNQVNRVVGGWGYLQVGLSLSCQLITISRQDLLLIWAFPPLYNPRTFTVSNCYFEDARDTALVVDGPFDMVVTAATSLATRQDLTATLMVTAGHCTAVTILQQQIQCDARVAERHVEQQCRCQERRSNCHQQLRADDDQLCIRGQHCV